VLLAVQPTLAAQPHLATAARGPYVAAEAAASSIRHMRHSRLLSLLTAQPQHEAQLLYGADACGAAALCSPRSRRSLLLPLFASQLTKTAQCRKWSKRSKLRSCFILLLLAAAAADGVVVFCFNCFKAAVLLRPRAVVHWSLWTTAGACLYAQKRVLYPFSFLVFYCAALRR
jgi:hypothetical protein